MFTGNLYGQTITAKTFTELKRKASRIANGHYDAVQTMEVKSEHGTKVSFHRYNKVTPNNTISFGQWK